MILLLMISMLRFLQCGVRLIPLVLHYHPALVTRVRLRSLLWQLGALMTFLPIFRDEFEQLELSWFREACVSLMEALAAMLLFVMRSCVFIMLAYCSLLLWYWLLVCLLNP